jgi:hypothetical protein
LQNFIIVSFPLFDYGCLFIFHSTLKNYSEECRYGKVWFSIIYKYSYNLTVCDRVRYKNKFPISLMNSLSVACLISSKNTPIWSSLRSLVSFYLYQRSPMIVSENSLRSLLCPPPFPSLPIHLAAKLICRNKLRTQTTAHPQVSIRKQMVQLLFRPGYETRVWFIVATIRVTFPRVYRRERFHELEELVFYHTFLA